MFKKNLLLCAALALLSTIAFSRRLSFTQQSALPSPPPVTIASDDRVATLTIGAGPLRPDQQEPAGVMGYCVTWGPESGIASKKLTVDRLVQLQPLKPGVTYTALVQSVDAKGNLGPASPSIHFTSDAARVNALRKQMTGFFDDFNNPEQPVDELKWNVAYSADNDIMRNGAFINTQFHAHTLVGNQNGFADRNQVVMRPRFVWDVTGRTGKGCFDFDGAGRGERDNWYLDMVPAPGVDITGHSSIDATSRAAPGNFIRLHQTAQLVEIQYVNPDGSEKGIARADLTWNSSLRLVANVRRHWLVHFSSTHIDVSIDGKQIITTNYPNLGYGKVVPLWEEFAYNPAKENDPALLQHFDNIGFDGPPSTVITHNYAVSNDGSEFSGGRKTVYTDTLTIPDKISTASSSRFFYTLENGVNQSYVWSRTDCVVLNGKSYSIPDPASSTGLTDTNLVTGISPYSASFPIPVSQFHTGANSVVFHLASCGVLNVHVEYYFPRNHTAPAYTQTTSTAQGVAVPLLQGIGPGVTGISVDKKDMGAIGIDNWAKTPLKVKGTIPVTALVENQSALMGTGVNPGVSKVNLLVDGRVMMTTSTTAAVPAPQCPILFQLNTRKLKNGAHTIYIQAFNPHGEESIVDMDGSYASHETPRTDIHLTVNN